jgi:hypothetical protein
MLKTVSVVAALGPLLILFPVLFPVFVLSLVAWVVPGIVNSLLLFLPFLGIPVFMLLVSLSLVYVLVGFSSRHCILLHLWDALALSLVHEPWQRNRDPTVTNHPRKFSNSSYVYLP